MCMEKSGITKFESARCALSQMVYSLTLGTNDTPGGQGGHASLKQT